VWCEKREREKKLRIKKRGKLMIKGMEGRDWHTPTSNGCQCLADNLPCAKEK